MDQFLKSLKGNLDAVTQDDEFPSDEMLEYDDNEGSINPNKFLNRGQGKQWHGPNDPPLLSHF